MLSKNEVYQWFLNLKGHRRMDFVCGLLHLCLPLELRVVGTCVEDLAKKDFHTLREPEVKANNVDDLEISTDFANEQVRSKLNFSLALLYSSNNACSQVLFNTLSCIDSFIRSLPPESLLLNQTISLLDDLLLLLSIAVNHPAFSFYQRQVLSEHLNNLYQLEHSLGCDEQNVSLKVSDTNENYEEVTHLILSPNDFSGHSVQLTENNEMCHNTQSANIPDNIPYRPRSNTQSKMEDAPFNKHYSFYHRSNRKPRYSRSSSVYIPGNYDISHHMNNVNLGNKSNEKFQHSKSSNLIGSINYPTLIHSPIASPHSSPQVSPSPNEVPRRYSHSTHSSNNSPARNYGPSARGGRRTPNQSRYTGRGRDLSHHAQHQPQTPKSGKSDFDTRTWLKQIRLHKYADKLGDFTLDQLLSLTDSTLTSIGLTSGACNKLKNEIAQLRGCGKQPFNKDSGCEQTCNKNENCNLKCFGTMSEGGLDVELPVLSCSPSVNSRSCLRFGSVSPPENGWQTGLSFQGHNPTECDKSFSFYYGGRQNGNVDYSSNYSPTNFSTYSSPVSTPPSSPRQPQDYSISDVDEEPESHRYTCIPNLLAFPNTNQFPNSKPDDRIVSPNTNHSSCRHSSSYPMFIPIPHHTDTSPMASTVLSPSAAYMIQPNPRPITLRPINSLQTNSPFNDSEIAPNNSSLDISHQDKSNSLCENSQVHQINRTAYLSETQQPVAPSTSRSFDSNSLNVPRTPTLQPALMMSPALSGHSNSNWSCDLSPINPPSLVNGLRNGQISNSCSSVSSPGSASVTGPNSQIPGEIPSNSEFYPDEEPLTLGMYPMPQNSAEFPNELVQFPNKQKDQHLQQQEQFVAVKTSQVLTSTGSNSTNVSKCISLTSTVKQINGVGPMNQTLSHSVNCPPPSQLSDVQHTISASNQAHPNLNSQTQDQNTSSIQAQPPTQINVPPPNLYQVPLFPHPVPPNWVGNSSVNGANQSVIHFNGVQHQCVSQISDRSASGSPASQIVPTSTHPANKNQHTISSPSLVAQNTGHHPTVLKSNINHHSNNSNTSNNSYSGHQQIPVNHPLNQNISVPNQHSGSSVNCAGSSTPPHATQSQQGVNQPPPGLPPSHNNAQSHSHINLQAYHHGSSPLCQGSSCSCSCDSLPYVWPTHAGVNAGFFPTNGYTLNLAAPNSRQFLPFSVPMPVGGAIVAHPGHPDVYINNHPNFTIIQQPSTAASRQLPINSGIHQQLPAGLNLRVPLRAAAPPSANSTHVFHGMKSKLMCPNCGLPGHRLPECKEPSMESITYNGSFHLNYKPKSDSE